MKPVTEIHHAAQAGIFEMLEQAKMAGVSQGATAAVALSILAKLLTEGRVPVDQLHRIVAEGAAMARPQKERTQ